MVNHLAVGAGRASTSGPSSSNTSSADSTNLAPSRINWWQPRDVRLSTLPGTANYCSNTPYLLEYGPPDNANPTKQGEKMAKVYSYVRFSHRRQEGGDSVRRQLAMGEAWLQRHPEHTLDHTLSLADLGVSAFKGANLDPEKGDLGKFIALAKKGLIQRGSILLIERLDRFSRQQTRKAYRTFCELIETGIKVLTLDPEQLIDENNIDNMEVVSL